MAVHKRKIGSILGMIGSTILMVVGFFTLSITRMYISSSIPIFVYIIAGVITAALAICGVLGSALAMRDNFTTGYTLLISAAVIGIFGTFIPIYAYDHGYGYVQMFFLINTAIYVDFVPMLIGGILGFALVEKREF